MLEYLKSSLKKIFCTDEFEQIASNILGEKCSNYADESEKKIAVQQLAIALRAYLSMDSYRVSDPKDEMQQRIFDIDALKIDRREIRLKLCLQLEKAGFIRYENYEYSELVTYGTWVTKESTRVYFPFVHLSPVRAIDGLKAITSKTLKEFYPCFYRDKTALTLMCMKRFRPHSLFAPVPVEIIKIIATQARELPPEVKNELLGLGYIKL